MTIATKVCNKCKQEFPLDNFHKNSTGRLGRNSYCKPCTRGYKRDLYQNARMDLKEIVFNHLSKNPCVDCGETDVLKLEFDHQARKEFNLGKMTVGKKKSVDEIKSEIAKCHVRCGSCHKAKTHKDQRTWKYRMALERKLHNA